MDATKSQYEATAKHHERMADYFRAVGRTEDAESAKEAARVCRESAKRA